VLLDEKETRGSGLFQVNMTPLIDVSLVLVVTLLLMTPLALESGIWVRGQDQPEPAASQQEPPRLVHLSILSENLVQVENRILQRDHLPPVLGAYLRQPGFSGVALGCADDVSHATFVDVLDKAKMSGAATIAISEEGGRS
jgi:biopolymer transport protein ExbD